MSDKYQPLRDAIAAGPTPGPWFAVNDGTEDEPMMSVKAARIAGRKPQHVVAICATGDSPQRMEDANAALIAAADPGTIAKLLKERDALRDALSEAQTRIAAIGYPASPDGEYSKDGEWTFSDAVPRAVDAGEVKAAFLVLRAALADGEAQS